MRKQFSNENNFPKLNNPELAKVCHTFLNCRIASYKYMEVHILVYVKDLDSTRSCSEATSNSG